MYLNFLWMRVSALFLGMCALVSCRDTAQRRTAETPPAETQAAPRADSVARVRAATALFRQRSDDSLMVYEYNEDSAGALISLIPKCPPPRGCVGGGGLVRVARNGKAQILNLYR